MPKSVAIVAGSYHEDKVKKMVEIVKSLSPDNNLLIEEVCWVPGSMEIPLQIKRLLLRESIHGVIVLGIIEKGETDMVCNIPSFTDSLFGWGLYSRKIQSRTKDSFS